MTKSRATERVSLLKERLTDCIAWLEASSYQLRSPVLEPPIFRLVASASRYNWLAEPSGRASVDGLAELRGALVRVRNPQPFAELNSTKDGKLLLSAPHWGTQEGNTSIVTGGYIDEYDAPPWDTWLDVVQEADNAAFYDTYLVAWVPAALIQLVDAGIRASPTGLLTWAADVNSAFTRQLRLASLL